MPFSSPSTKDLLASHPNGKLGKMAPKLDPRTLQLSDYLVMGALPAPPALKDFSKSVASWPMMKNDTVGDCTIAAGGHMIEQWTTYIGSPFIPSDDDIIRAYSAVSGYDPATGANDNGAVMLDVLNYWRQNGIASHNILGYVSVNPKNQVYCEDSVYLFGNLYLGVALPLSAQTQVTWAVPPQGPKGRGAPGSWGGHAIPVVAYNRQGLMCVTWGSLKWMTWQFLKVYCDEAYAVLSMDWINKTNNLSPSNFRLDQLQADLKLL